MKKFKILTAIILLGAALYSCKDDDDTTPAQSTPISPNEEELITTVDLIFTDSATTMKDTFSFNDIDGDGGNAPTIDTIRLKGGVVYNLLTEFKDASDPNDVEDITAEIREEDDEHLICFEPNNIFHTLFIDRTDSDGMYEVGLESRWEVGIETVISNGKLKLTLKHQPGSKDGSCAAGDTDVEVDFPLVIQ